MKMREKVTRNAMKPAESDGIRSGGWSFVEFASLFREIFSKFWDCRGFLRSRPIGKCDGSIAK